MFGDGTEIWVLEKAGIGRADMVVAVTGDDEDNIIISQVAKLKFGVPKVVARVNNPFNQPTFDLLGVEATICAATSMLRLILHELPVHKFVHLLSLRRENVELVELEVSENSPFANTYVQDIDLPDGVILAAIVRAEHAMMVRGSTEILPGDYVLCLLQPGRRRSSSRSSCRRRTPTRCSAPRSSTPPKAEPVLAAARPRAAARMCAPPPAPFSCRMAATCVPWPRLLMLSSPRAGTRSPETPCAACGGGRSAPRSR